MTQNPKGHYKNENLQASLTCIKGFSQYGNARERIKRISVEKNK